MLIKLASSIQAESHIRQADIETTTVQENSRFVQRSEISNLKTIPVEIELTWESSKPALVHYDAGNLPIDIIVDLPQWDLTQPQAVPVPVVWSMQSTSLHGLPDDFVILRCMRVRTRTSGGAGFYTESPPAKFIELKVEP
jgi:hypothetical protein